MQENENTNKNKSRIEQRKKTALAIEENNESTHVPSHTSPHIESANPRQNFWIWVLMQGRGGSAADGTWPGQRLIETAPSADIPVQSQ